MTTCERSAPIGKQYPPLIFILYACMWFQDLKYECMYCMHVCFIFILYSIRISNCFFFVLVNIYIPYLYMYMYMYMYGIYILYIVYCRRL